jgi:repressor LexA
MNDITSRFLDIYNYLLNSKKTSSASDFAKKIEISTSLMSEILKKRTNAGINPIQKTVSEFPEINSEWLLTGKGEMIKTKSKENTTFLNGGKNGGENGGKPKVKKNLPMVMEESSMVREESKKYFVSDIVKKIPLIPVEAMAGFGTGSIQVMDYDTETYNVPEFTELNVDFMIKVKGSSMYPKYSSGDLVACKKLFIKDIFFQWNKVYVLDTEQGALIKRIKKSDKEECVMLHSENPSYDPFELHLSKIHAVALVVGVIRLE